MGMTWFKALAVFGQELITDPRPIGAACPSSPRLARRVARRVGNSPEHYVLEIGAGTGSITSALLKHCVPPERLIALERSASMVRLLQQRFQGVRIIEGDACELTSLLARSGVSDLGRITHIVSSLPLRSLQPDQVQLITGEFLKVMKQRTQLIQYTYNLRHGSRELFDRLYQRSSSVVWLNLPPARVEAFSTVPATEPRSGSRKRPPAKPAPFVLTGGTKVVNASPRH